MPVLEEAGDDSCCSQTSALLNRSVRGTLLAACSRCMLVVLMIIHSACTNPSGEHGAVTVLDSAGISIVINEQAAEDILHWSTEQTLAIGELDGPEEYSFGEIADVDVDDSGQLFVLDRQAQQAMVYGPDGRFRFAFGGAGEGPGEFSRQLMNIRMGPRGSMAVLDYLQMRLNVFDAAGAPIRTLPMHIGRQGPYQFHFLADGRLLVRWFTYNIDSDQKFVPWDVLLLSNRDQTAFDTLLAFDYRRPDLGGLVKIKRPMLTNAAFYDVLADGAIIWSDLAKDHIAIHAADGGLRQIVRNNEWQRRSVNAEDRDALTALFRLQAAHPDRPLPGNVSFPDSVPPITAIQASPDGGFWVQRMGPLSAIDPGALFLPAQVGWLGGTKWEVYDRRGSWYATVEVPQRFRITRVLDSTVVGVKRDELDVERVVVLRLVR